MIVALWLVTALAQEPPDVVQTLGTARINWTSLTVEASGAHIGTGVASSRKASEHMARQQLGPGIRDAISAISVTSDLSVPQLQEQGQLGEAVRLRASRWVISEARYYASGKVELDGELSLVDVLKPWVIAGAAPPPADGPQPAFTGIVVDARGINLGFAYAPRLLAPDGGVLFDGRVWSDVATQVAPARYVSDAAHPEAKIAGSKPLTVKVASARGPDLVLSAEDAVRYRTAFRDARAPGEGKLVIVVTPP